jgi:protein-disulfide isomerase
VFKLSLAVGARDHVLGPSDAQFTLVEYGDFECPACGAAYPVLKELRKRMGHRARFVFRNFPLTQIHPRAERAAMAAEAAGREGRFWEMHDRLFENQDALEDEHLLRYAAAVDVDEDAFAEALEDPKLREHVREDFVSGVRSGVDGTPTFFVNGVRFDGSVQLLGRALLSEAA